MIGTIQKERMIGRLLQQIYIKGRTPSLAELRRKLADIFAGKIVGLPLFEPRTVAPSQIVDPDLLTANIVEIKEDLDTLNDWINETLKTEAVLFGAFDEELTALDKKLEKKSAELSNILLQEYHISKNGITDSFNDSSKIDLQQSNVLINNQAGFVALPPSTTDTVRFPSTNVQVIEESLNGAVSTTTSFLNALTDYADEVWQVNLGTNGTYSVILNMTGLPVVAGHDNEIEVNRITLTPVGSFTITIESSVDGLNWQTLATKAISSYTIFDFDPTWILFLRITIAGSNAVGIQHMDVWKIHTAEKASMYSVANSIDNNVASFIFSTNEELPHGTAIKHYIKLADIGSWSQILPGIVNINNLIVNTHTVSGLVYDPIESLYSYSINDDVLEESGVLQRGLDQFFVRAFSFNWSALGDEYHIPKLEDFDGSHGLVHSTYMSPLPACYYPNVIPSGTAVSTTSFILDYSGASAKWWGICISAGTGNPGASGMILAPETSYCITTYLYSDRDIYIENAGGGVYLVAPTSVTCNMSFAGWSLYLNGGMLISNNKVGYIDAIPEMETLTADKGQMFPLSLRRGWNKFDLLVYIPENALINDVYKANNIVLYLRPGIINYKPESDLLWEKLPVQATYPIWADGRPLTRVSAFYLRWNVPPANRDYWAWHINEYTQQADSVLLNNDPSSILATIDGRFTGNPYNLTLSYSPYISGTQTLYYRADLERGRDVLASPRLYEYSITPLVGT